MKRQYSKDMTSWYDEYSPWHVYVRVQDGRNFRIYPVTVVTLTNWDQLIWYSLPDWTFIR